jgi:carboxypeptidase PM20D1
MTNPKPDFKLDFTLSVARFSELLIYETVDGNRKEFEKFINALKQLYPEIHRTCEFERVAVNEKCPGGLMYRLKGKDSSKSILLMSHFDVVPAERKDLNRVRDLSVDSHDNTGDYDWVQHPFSGGTTDNVIYGRGALDTKCTLCAVMESIEVLLEYGFVPDYDVYMCFGGDEETTSTAAIAMADLLKERGINPFLVVDEGGAVVDASMVGGSSRTALIGIAEKGYMDVEFITRGKGGHTSMPTRSNPLSIMARAIRRLDKPFKPVISEPLKIMGRAIIKNSGFKVRFALNSPLLRKLLLPQAAKLVPEVGALIQTTGAITQISGGSAKNVIPEEVRAVGNFRIINGSSVEETLSVIKKTLRGLDVEVNLLPESLEPSAVSRVDGRGWERLNTAINQTWDDDNEKCVVIPYLMFARSDSRFYSDISDSVYRFSPMIMSKQDRSAIHGVNERISTEAFRKMIEFYLALITSDTSGS